MKITVITITLNSEKTIRDTLNSVISQSYKNIEHILVDGGSTDNTISILKNYKNKNKKIFIKKKFKIYESINYAIKKSSGKFICILNSDDIFQSNNTIDKFVKFSSKHKKIDIFFGETVYFNFFNYHSIKRYYSSKNFKVFQMRYGLMPPHPSSFISRNIYKKYGLYDKSFKIAGDFEIFLRYFFVHRLNFKFFDQIVVRMRTGGISGSGVKSYIINTLEILRALKKNKIYSNIFLILMRFPIKLKQLYFIDDFKLNKNFRLFNLIFDKKNYYENSFKIIDNLKNLLQQKKNFILSGMNLAFLGYYAVGIVFPYKDLYHWPDGVWAKKISKFKKIPGRELLKNILLPKRIKKIIVIGNLSKKSFNYLKNRFKLEIENIKLPYGEIKKIKKKIILPRNTLTLITLPTPKQEQYAYYLSTINKYYNIICIGASVSIASGEEKEVPKILYNYEFLWRLKSDFFRRSKRLLETMLFYINGKFYKNIFEKTRFIEIE